MEPNPSSWALRCVICGALLSPLAVHQAGIPSDCKCPSRPTVEQQATTPPEQPDTWPEVLQVIPEQVSNQSVWVSAVSTAGYESLRGTSSGTGR
jgi:hypothetical protein